MSAVVSVWKTASMDLEWAPIVRRVSQAPRLRTGFPHVVGPHYAAETVLLCTFPQRLLLKFFIH